MQRLAVLSSPLPQAALLRGGRFCVTAGEVFTWLSAFAAAAWGGDGVCVAGALAATGGPVPSSPLPHAALLRGGRCRVAVDVVVVWLSAFAASAWGHAMAGWRVPLQVWVRGGCGRHLCRMRHCCVASCFASPPRWWSSGCRRFEAVLEEGGGATRCGREVCVGVVSSCPCRCACQDVSFCFFLHADLVASPSTLLCSPCHDGVILSVVFFWAFALPTPSLSPAPRMQTVPSVAGAHSSRHAVGGRKGPLMSPEGWAASTYGQPLPRADPRPKRPVDRRRGRNGGGGGGARRTPQTRGRRPPDRYHPRRRWRPHRHAADPLPPPPAQR